MIKIKHKGNFANSEKFFKKAQSRSYLNVLNRLGQEGVNALSAATPTDSNLTANSWNYEVRTNSKEVSIQWTNSNIVDGVPVVILLQYGHGTRNGGFVQGRDFINPAIKPVFDKILNDMWREVTT